MPYADDVQAAINAMRDDSDPRWHAVADLLGGGAVLGLARMADQRPDPASYVRNYPDVQRGLAVARAYLDVTH